MEPNALARRLRIEDFKRGVTMNNNVDDILELPSSPSLLEVHTALADLQWEAFMEGFATLEAYEHYETVLSNYLKGVVQ